MNDPLSRSFELMSQSPRLTDRYLVSLVPVGTGRFPVSGEWVGFGMKASAFTAAGSNRLLGMILPGKGSRTIPPFGPTRLVNGLYSWRGNCEKLPCFITAVGTVSKKPAG